MFETILKIVDVIVKVIGAIVKIIELLHKNRHQKNNRPSPKE